MSPAPETQLEAKIVAAVAQAGPRNVAEVSRLTGIHQETLRYKMKRRFRRLGIRFRAEVDYAKLGLSLWQGRLNFSEAHEADAVQAIRSLGYAVEYGKVVPHGSYVVLFAIPDGLNDEYVGSHGWGALLRLRREGMLLNYAMDRVVGRRCADTDLRFFNFGSRRWDVPWSSLAAEDPRPSQTPTSKPKHFDANDLIIAKEIQRDPMAHLAQIARKVKVHQKTLEYHYRTHVQNELDLMSYRSVWVPDGDQAITTRLSFRSLGERTQREVRDAVGKIPFLLSEVSLVDGSSYAATITLPLTELAGMMEYVSASVPDLFGRVDVEFIDRKRSGLFTIPYHMFRNGKWRLPER